MENFKLPAYPLPIAIDGRDVIFDTTDYGKLNGGFTKLELAALMIAQGMSSDNEWFSGKDPLHHIAKQSVLLAKLVLEEANK